MIWSVDIDQSLSVAFSRLPSKEEIVIPMSEFGRKIRLPEENMYNSPALDQAVSFPVSNDFVGWGNGEVGCSEMPMTVTENEWLI